MLFLINEGFIKFDIGNFLLKYRSLVFHSEQKKFTSYNIFEYQLKRQIFDARKL